MGPAKPEDSTLMSEGPVPEDAAMRRAALQAQHHRRALWKP